MWLGFQEEEWRKQKAMIVRFHQIMWKSEKAACMLKRLWGNFEDDMHACSVASGMSNSLQPYGP